MFRGVGLERATKKECISLSPRPGESIRLVGEAEELGKWNPDRSVPLCTDAKSYPMWTTAEPVWLRQKPGKKRLETYLQGCVVRGGLG